MDISCIGILTVVAYQTLVNNTLPRIPYFTVMRGFIYISFLLMCATVVVNPVVGQLDRTGQQVTGDLVDRHGGACECNMGARGKRYDLAAPCFRKLPCGQAGNGHRW